MTDGLKRGECVTFIEEGKRHYGWFQVRDEKKDRTLVRRMSGGGEVWVKTTDVIQGLVGKGDE